MRLEFLFIIYEYNRRASYFLYVSIARSVWDSDKSIDAFRLGNMQKNENNGGKRKKWFKWLTYQWLEKGKLWECETKRVKKNKKIKEEDKKSKENKKSKEEKASQCHITVLLQMVKEMVR